MRPRRSTSVISTVTMAAPVIASIIQCWRCQSEAEPSSAEYWHIGDTAMRLLKSRPPMLIGEKRLAGMGAPEVARGLIYPDFAAAGPVRGSARRQPGAVVKFAGVVGAGERGCRGVDAEEGAERRPALADVEDQQALRRKRCGDLGDVGPVDRERVGLVERAAAEHLLRDGLALHRPAGGGERVAGSGWRQDLRADGGGEAAEPVLGRADGEDDPRLRESGGELAPVARARPVDLGAVAGEDGGPVHRAAEGGGLPERDLLRVGGDLVHVMAGTEAELVEREAQGIGAGAAETCTEDLERHHVLPGSSAL